MIRKAPQSWGAFLWFLREMSGYINGYLMASGDTHSTRAPFGLRPTPSLTRQLRRLVWSTEQSARTRLAESRPVISPFGISRLRGHIHSSGNVCGNESDLWVGPRAV